MIQLLLMLLGLAFSNHNGNTCNNNGGTVTTQDAGTGGGTGFDPGTGTDPGDTGGETIPLPPKK